MRVRGLQVLGERLAVTRGRRGRDGRAAAPSLAAGAPVSHAIVQLAKAHKAAAAGLLREIGLYPGQELLLMHLWDTGRQTHVELGRGLNLDPSTVTRMVTRLEQQGIVRREASTLDRRAVTVSLTQRGTDLCKEIRRLWGDLEAATTAGMSAQDRDDLLAVLKGVTGTLTTPTT